MAKEMENFEVKEGKAYTKSGYLVGKPALARYLEDHGIVPELIAGHYDTCTIGFCAADQKWYGWSEKAIKGFGIGDEIRPNEAGGEKFPNGKIAGNLDDAKLMAIAFAEAVE
jgi:hypothetical protein